MLKSKFKRISNVRTDRNTHYTDRWKIFTRKSCQHVGHNKDTGKELTTNKPSCISKYKKFIFVLDTIIYKYA